LGSKHVEDIKSTKIEILIQKGALFFILCNSIKIQGKKHKIRVLVRHFFLRHSMYLYPENKQ